MDILRSSGLEYEFRTTVVRELHTSQDIEALTEWIYFAPHYYLQSFKDSGDILRSGLSSYSEEEMKQILAKAKLRLACAELRGI